MKKKSRKSVSSEVWELPTEEEVEIIELLVHMPKYWAKSELISKYSFTWGVKKKRSVLDSIPESFAQMDTSPSTPLCIASSSSSGSDGCDKGKAPMYEPNVLKRKATYDLSDSISESSAQQTKSPTSPLCFVPSGGSSGSGSDGDYKGKAPMYGPNVLKKKATDDLMVIIHNRLQQEKDIIMKQQRCHQQITMFAPTTTQMVVDPTQVASCSTNSNAEGTFGLFNQIHPRVKTHHVETYDFMGSFQLLDQSRYMVMNNDLKVRAAAADARKRRKLVLKEKRKLSNVGHETINIG